MESTGEREMKLCKDCRHSVLPRVPSPYANVTGFYTPPPPQLLTAHCGHPDAPRDVVYGDCTRTCDEARGMAISGCGPDAKLFEESLSVRTLKALQDEATVLPGPSPAPERKPSFFKRIFG